MIDFENLAKKSVHIGLGNGRWTDVPMLTLADMQEAGDIQRGVSCAASDASLTDLQRYDAIEKARKRLGDLAMKVMPPELEDGVRRMDLVALTGLVAVLCTGNDGGGKDSPEKKTTFPSQMRE